MINPIIKIIKPEINIKKKFFCKKKKAKTEINGIKEAIPLVRELISRKTQDKVVNVIPINKARHYIFVTENGLKYWMLFKREFFLSFGKIFGFKGCGDSVNAEFVGKALNMKIDGFLFVYKNDIRYWCKLKSP